MLRIVEKLLLITTVITLLVRNYSEADSMYFTLSLLTLCCLYGWVGFLIFTGVRLRSVFKQVAYSHLKTADIIIAAIAGVSISMLIIGILFKAQYWPGATPNLAGGITCVTAITIISIIRLKSNKVIYTAILTRTIPMIALAVILYNMPLSMRMNLFKVHNTKVKVSILNDTTLK